MAKMSTSAIYERFLGLYGEKSSRYVKPEIAIHLINDSIDDLDSEIADAHPEFAGLLSTTVGYTVDTQEVSLPDGLIEVVTVEVTDRGGPPWPRLLPARFTDRGALSGYPSADWMAGGGKGEPAYYYVRGVDPASSASKIGWIPIPTRTATGNVTVWYHGVRADIAAIDDSTYPDLPIDWHPLVPMRMCVVAAITENNPGLVSYQELYASRLRRRLGAALRGRSEAASEIIEIVDDDW